MNALYFTAHTIFRVWFRVYFRWRVYHADRVPRVGPVILASNHASFLDPPMVGTALPRPISYLARENLFRYPVVGSVLRRVHAVPVDRDGGSPAGLKTILDRLTAGEAVVLFPEGTRTRDGRLQSARSGIGLVAAKTNAPVIPVRLFGTFEAYGRHLTVPRPHRVTVKFGQPVALEPWRRELAIAGRPRAKVIYQRMAEEIMAAIGRLEPCRDKAEF